MNIIKATRKYESWLAGMTEIIQSEIDLKHKNMAENPFSFFRAAFYRWIQVFNKVCKDDSSAPYVLGVGDLHVENFGTWRDIEGRLVWGINDFDETYYLPYTNDLIRLTASAHLAISENHLKLEKADACDSILKGYIDSLTAGGGAFVLSDKHKWLHDAATFRLKDPVKFWDKMSGFKESKKGAQGEIVKTLLKSMPGYSPDYKLVQRIAGLGSLGRQRVVVIANWNGGLIAREAKAFVPSTYVFIDEELPEDSFYEAILDNAVRCKDPYLSIKKKWIIHRLAPDCSRIELESLPAEHDEAKLLYAMGWETANIHMGSKKEIKAVKKDITGREKHWLHKAAESMLDAMESDYKEWKDEYAKNNDETKFK